MRFIEDSFDWKQYQREPQDTERVLPASAFADGVIDRFYDRSFLNGPRTPWSKLDDKFVLRPREVTVWAGVNGHGKSLVTGQVAYDLARQGVKTLIASFEMPAAATLARIARQGIGNGEPTKEYVRLFLDWLGEQLFIYDLEGLCDQAKLVAVLRYAAEQGVQHVFIDSLMKVVKGEDDYNGQKLFVDNCCAIARDTGLHIHLVHHIKKLESEMLVPGKFDLKGSGSVSDQCDNVVIVWRNKRKEEQLSNPLLKQEERDKLASLPDALLNICKQRHYEWEGKASLYLDHRSLCFFDHLGWKHMPWVPKQRRSIVKWTDQVEPYAAGFTETEVSACL